MSDQDHLLIAEFNAQRSEAAFAALVQQHVNLVFATAWRQVGERGAAEEITQSVFLALAQSAGKLGSHPTIAGWLYQTTLNKSRKRLRSDLRRQRREQVAVNLALAGAEGESVWSALVPLLDEALLELREPDRLAVILHFMEGRTFQEVGSALGISEDAARKRTNRCLDHLTQFFSRHGFGTPALAGAPLFLHSSPAAPAGLAKIITAAAMIKGAASSSTLTLIKGALKFMAWTKAKTAAVASLGILLIAGTTVTVKEIQEHKTYSWQNLPTYGNLLDEVPPQVRIVPTKYSQFGECTRMGKVLGTGMPVKYLLADAYGSAPARVVATAALPTRKYDFIANLPAGNGEALQKEIKKKFGLVGRSEVRPAEVLALKVSSLARLQTHVFNGKYDFKVQQGLQYGKDTLSSIAGGMEFIFDKPIVDQTGMAGDYHLQFLATETNFNSLQERILTVRETLVAELDQAGLELVPTNLPVEMLVVEKAKD